MTHKEQNNVSGKKSILDQILEDFSDSLAKSPDFNQDVAQSLVKIIIEGEYKYKEKIIDLFKNPNT